MNITDAAKQAGIDPMDLPDICREVVWVATMNELERFAQIIRNQVLEDAAEKSDSCGHHWSGAPASAFFELAETIRSMKKDQQ